jgi:dinuclear metal center YbgI/SA1388 family protein
MTVTTVAQFLTRLAPSALAADWDNTGLLVGDPAGPADRVMTCLTVTPAVVAEAVAEQCQLIVTHHPVLFRGAKRLTAGDPDGRLLLPLVRVGVAVYSPHTRFDNCPGGINDGLCTRLGLGSIRPLRPKGGAKLCKLVVFTPEADLGTVSDAVFAAGGGVIGNYDQCSFRVAGTGTFFPRAGANPTVGQVGKREEAGEHRLEVIVPEARRAACVAAAVAAHSYEEPAIDVYPLVAVAQGGEGRVGELPAPVPLGELAAMMKAKLNAAVMQTVGDPARPARRVAVACGAAGEFLPDAIGAGADVFLTGEVRFHDARAAEAAGVGLLLPGHYASERPGVEDLAGRLAAEFPAATVWASRAERDPLGVV